MDILAPIFVRLLQASSQPCETSAVVLECNPGIRDCCSFGQEKPLDSCAFYDDEMKPPQSLLWVLILAFFTTALMAFGIGANDAANSWGTSVGSGAISLTHAVLVGGLMDWLGAVALGSGVSDTIRQGVADIKQPDCWACGYCDSDMSLYMLGMMCALLSTAAFLLLASYTSMPVSTTHAIVGAVVGFTIVGTKASCLKLSALGYIALSWVASPLLSGAIGSVLYYVLHRTVIQAPGSEERALTVSPYLFASTTLVMAALILMKSTLTKHLPWFVTGSAAVGVALVAFYIARAHLVHEIRRRIVATFDAPTDIELGDNPARGSGADGDSSRMEGAKLASGVPSSSAVPEGASSRGDGGGLKAATERVGLADDTTTSPGSQKVDPWDDVALDFEGEIDGDLVDMWDAVLPSGPQVGTAARVLGVHASESYSEEQTRALFVFRYLLVFVAALESFAHGANDTGNATGAFSAVWGTYQNGLSSCSNESTPVWIMAFGGGFVCLGVICFGGRVIRTVGSGLTQVNFLRGFAIELASTTSVVLATLIGMPVSTTHCQVGAVVFVGATSFGIKSVSWKMFGWIALTWLVTIPFSALLSAALLALLRPTISA